MSLECVKTSVGVSDVVQNDGLVSTASKKEVVDCRAVSYCKDFSVMCFYLVCGLASCSSIPTAILLEANVSRRTLESELLH